MARTLSTVQATVQAYGGVYDSNDPARSLYALILAAHRPSDQRVGGGWDILAESSLRMRIMLYAESNIGDCGELSPPSINIAQQATGAAISGAQIGELIAGVSVTSALGIATAGVGFAASEIFSILQHHAGAVAAEKQNLCSGSAQVNQGLKSIDNAVQSGLITGAVGFQVVQQISNQFTAQVQPLEKGDNAYYGMSRIMLCHQDLRGYLYGVTPIPPSAPGLHTLIPMLEPTPPPVTSGFRSSYAPTPAAFVAPPPKPSGVAPSIAPPVPVVPVGTPGGLSGGIALFGYTVPVWALLLLMGAIIWAFL